MFLNKQNQDFIIYSFEGFNNNNIILDFKEKIKQVKLLSKEEKINLLTLIEKIDIKLFYLISKLYYYIL